MKRKRRKKGGWFRFIGLSIFFTLLAWVTAFALWLFWPNLQKLYKSAERKITSQETVRPSQEKILEEDRKQLEKILKQRK